MKKLIIFLIAGFLFSCQREDVPASFADETTISVLTPEPAENTFTDGLAMVALTGQTHIPVEEAQQTALQTASQMREVEGILTKSTLQIASIDVVKDNIRKPYVPTKSGESTETADVYIINFADNQGYVVTSADRRVPGVLAYNSYGHLGDTITNPGQAILFSYIQDYIETEREAFEANKETLRIQAEEAIFKQLSKERQEVLIAQGYFDTNGKRIVTKSRKDNTPCYLPTPEHNEPAYTKITPWEVVSLKPPLIKTLWHQSGDYNNKVSMQCGRDEAPVGCVATAVGQLMAYHKKPAVFKGRTMHWNDMTEVKPWNMS